MDLDKEELKATRLLNGADKIEVGEYVRYKSGLIRKVTRIIPIYENGLLLSNSYNIEFDNLGNTAIYKNDYVEKVITKHSKNIIDLIEVGDYVNGELVREPIDLENGYNSDYTGYQQFINSYGKIKSIVTKEQYASIEYIV